MTFTSKEKIWLKSYDKHIPPSLDYILEELGTCLTNAMETFKDRIGFYFMDRAMTYGEILNLSQRFATFLQKNGLKKGDVVSVNISIFYKLLN
ncbi:MAG: hypothetical protein ACTSXH_17390 [Promethearchaeota archaeon]